MNTLNCLIVDDEELARVLIENYASRLPQLKVVASCTNPIEAISILQDQPIDLIFLDIQMPGMTGTEFLKTLSNRPMVIFTTAYSEYALEGYDLDVIDYLLKPFSFERFFKAVTKASDLWKLKKQNNQPTENKEVNQDSILVKSEHKVYRIYYKDINYIQSMREYVAFYTTNGRILSLRSLKGLEVELPKNLFIRIHKSYIIAKQKATTLEGNRIHIQKEKIPIGASYRENVLKELF